MKTVLIILFLLTGCFAKAQYIEIIGDSVIGGYNNGNFISIRGKVYQLPFNDYGSLDIYGNPKYVFKPLTPPNFTVNDIVLNPKTKLDSIAIATGNNYNKRVLTFYNNVIVGARDTTINTLPKMLDVILILGRLNGMIDSTGFWRAPINGIK